MNKLCFRVTVHREDCTQEAYVVLAANDVDAREKAVKLDDKSYQKVEDAPEIEYCEIALALEVDA